MKSQPREIGSQERNSCDMPHMQTDMVTAGLLTGPTELATAATCHNDNLIGRRGFLRMAGAGAMTLMASQLPVMAGPFDNNDFEREIPRDKKLDPEWVKSLFTRGTPTVYRGAHLNSIGMPIGGLCAGQLYLGGDGKLWHWDIFNQHIGTGDAHYVYPLFPNSPLEQGFAIRVTSGGQTQTRGLDKIGFSDITFRGQYPIADIEYRDNALPVAVSLEAFSPFIPLATDDSSLPATILNFTVRNTSSQPIEALLSGWLQNAVSLHHSWPAQTRRNRIMRDKGLTFLECSVDQPPAVASSTRPDIVFEDWNKSTFEGWTVEGRAFGSGPVRKADIPAHQGDVGGPGERVVNSHAAAPAARVEDRDSHTGKLTSRPFTIERNFLNFWIGGGSHRDQTTFNLLVDGKVVHAATGASNNRMSEQTFDLRALQGRQAALEIIDSATGAWGHIGVGRITASDRPVVNVPLEEMSDYGTMGLALLGAPAEHTLAHSQTGGFEGRGGTQASAPLDQPLIGALGRTLRLRPGQSATVSFVLTWHFPNLSIEGLGKVGRHYGTRFDSARAVANYIGTDFGRLTGQTRLWRDTWYDSTLPFWFLDRTFLNTSILATSTSYRFANGRFYGWEGVGCCPGTCTHVWHYAQAVGRTFPELERSAREMADYGAGFDADSGRIRFRAEHNNHWAVDGQAGCILRVYREHQMSRDSQFLQGVWPRVKKSLEWMIQHDPNTDGIMDGAQHNTLDADWFGRVAWLSSLYVTALRAGAAMASEMGDSSFAAQARTIAEAGSRNISRDLFNGEYFIHLPDPAHVKTVGSYDGCEIDQVFGQSWAHQVGLGRVLPQAQVRTALASLWRYNFTPDVGPFRAKRSAGRWYAVAGEGGLIMCTWPRGESSRVSQHFDFYFNENMSGFEYQVAGHMLWEGMVMEGLAITRAIHDRYHAARRNPWNEVECGDHYARAMASYGVFVAACGFEYHGPQGTLAFAPKLTPQNFKAAFTSAEGWGSFAQKSANNRFQAEVALKWGRLNVKVLSLALPQSTSTKTVRVTHNSRPLSSTYRVQDNRLIVTMASPLDLQAGQNLEVSVR
ncbi:MAG: non-lysosomal glucosylceramidase [Abditibacteriota bacterium]|nr:non-lysosomal glucosylceramidase [Abditibacteriota bacterium]